jgi:DNA-binding CsgD family transcriptional regulator/tetratricopeptide (TPR) repeat protein
VTEGPDAGSRLYGRDDEVARIRRHVERRVPVVVSGEAGIGKTALIRVAVGEQRLEGGGFATLSWLDYFPLTRALGRPLPAGDAAFVAATVAAEVGDRVLVVDDGHWCDAATRGVLPVLAGRVALVVAVRRGDRGAPVLLDALDRAGFASIELGALPEEPALRLARDAVPELTDGQARRLVRRAGGNPFLIHELAVAGDATPSLKVALEARLRGLTADGRELFTAIALVGRPLPADVVPADELAAAGLVDVTSAGQLAVRHALMAEVAVAALSASEHAEAHRRAAALVDDDGERARHLAAAGDTRRAHDLALAAAERASRAGERARHLQVAARCAPAGATDLRLDAARALLEAGDFAAVEEVLATVDTVDAATAAAVALVQGRVRWEMGDDEGSRAAFAEGLTLAAGSGTSTEVHLRIEETRLPLFVDGDYGRGVELATRALELARARTVGVAAAELLLGTALALSARPGWEAHLTCALSLARRQGDVDVELRAANNLIGAHESNGDPTVGRKVAITAIERAHALGLLGWEHQLRAMVANLDMLAGRYDDALRDADRLLAEPLQSRTRDQLEVTRALALIDLGRFEDARRQADTSEATAAPDAIGREQFRYLRAEIDVWSGRPRHALRALDALIARVPADFEIATFARLTRARAAADLGIGPGPLSPLHPARFFEALPAEEAALQAQADGAHSAAAEAFAEAARLWAPHHVRSALFCRWAEGEARLRAGDLTAARRVLETVEAATAERAMEPLLARVRRSLRRAGRRMPPTRPRVARTGGARSPTAAELDVLRLVARGLTNAEIAARLGRSRRTIETQLASAAAKLGAGSRWQAAALVDP